MWYLTEGALNKYNTHITADAMSQTEHALPPQQTLVRTICTLYVIKTAVIPWSGVLLFSTPSKNVHNDM